MRKLFVLALVLVLCIPLASYAASIGGAETQGKGKLGIGLDTEYIFGRDWEFDSASNLPANTTTENIETEKGYYAGAKIAYGLLENLEVYARLGTADYEVEYKRFTGGSETATEKFNTDSAFAYGFGIKGIYNLNENLLLGCDLQYRRSKHDSKYNYTPVAGSEESTKYESVVHQEWHVAPYVGYKMGNFVPYLGVRYSDARMKMSEPGNALYGDLKIKADDNVGVFLGTDYKIGEHWKFNIEGRFVDETAMSFAATYKF